MAPTLPEIGIFQSRFKHSVGRSEQHNAAAAGGGIILANDFNRATGFELIGASDGSSGGDLQGTLAQALNAGAKLGADWIEIYAVDAMNPQYVRTLAKFNKLLK